MCDGNEHCDKIVTINPNFNTVSYFYTAERFHTLQICFVVYMTTVVRYYVDKRY